MPLAAQLSGELLKGFLKNQPIKPMPGDGYKFIEMAVNNKRANQERERLNIRQALQSAASLAGVIGGQVKQAKTNKNDAIANSLMNEMAAIPRAQAVGDDAALVQAMADKKAEKMPGFHTGGVDELTMRMALEKHQNQNADRTEMSDDRAFRRALEKSREARMVEELDLRKRQAEQDAAKQAAGLTNDKTKESVIAANAYFKQKKVIEDAMRQAQLNGDFDSYNSYAQDLQAIHFGTSSAGVKLPELSIPPFRDPEQDPLIASLESQLAENDQQMAAGDKTKGNFLWWGGTPRTDIKSSLEKQLNETRTKAERPVDKFTPQEDDESTASQESGAGGMPVGTMAVNRQTGQRIRWNGKSWEPVQ